MTEFVPFQKIPRLRRGCVITEKIDGTNAQVFVDEEGGVHAGSRNRWVMPTADNYGFAKWVYEHADGLRVALGPGRHFGEWWGLGIQRGYGLTEKRFSLFNAGRWQQSMLPDYVGIVPVLYAGVFNDIAVEGVIERLRVEGSVAAPGFMKPEGIVVYHSASGYFFKRTLDNDDEPKGKQP